MSEEFLKYAENVKKLSKKPSDEQLLELYSLYKQATVGDCDTESPGMLKFKEKAKWNAWKSKAGMPKNQAEEGYILLAKKLIAADV